MMFVYILLSLVAVLLAIAALLPGKYHVEHSAIIKKSVNEVIDKVADLHHYAKWNPWQIGDAKGTVKITGEPKTIGHCYSWNGNKIGMGSLTIKAIDDRHVHFDLIFLKPWNSKAKDNWFFEEWGDSDTKVTWENNGNLPYPVPRLMGRLIHKNLNKQFIRGMNNLKKLCEDEEYAT